MLMIHEAMDSKLSYCLLVCILCTVCYFSGQPASFDRICNVQPEQTKYYAIYHNAMCSVPFLSFVLDSLFDHTAKSADIFTQFNSKILINLYDIYIYIYIYIYTHTHTYIYFCFCPHFSWAELKDLRLFLCTQKAYFSQILFTNLSKSVLVSTSLPR